MLSFKKYFFLISIFYFLASCKEGKKVENTSTTEEKKVVVPSFNEDSANFGYECELQTPTTVLSLHLKAAR